MEKVLRNGSFQFVPLSPLEALAIGRAEIEMGSLELVVLLIMVDDVFDCNLVVEASLVNCLFGEVRFDCVKFAEMAPAVALVTKTVLMVVVREISICQFGSSFVKDVFVFQAVLVVVETSLSHCHS